MSELIAVQNLNFSYQQHPVLDQISFSISTGDYVSIIGPNGSGKSTLLKCLNRIVRTQPGVIKILGKEVETYSQKELGKIIGYLPQSREQLFPYTVHEFVMMGRYVYLPAFAYTAAKDHKIVEQVLGMTGLTDLAQRRVNTLSGGERQKVYLAAALAQEPKILLLDEPTTHLDPKHHIDIQRMIRDISQKCGMTVIHVTHDLQHLGLWPQKILALKKGRLIFKGPADDVLTPENLKTIFGTSFIFVTHPGGRQKFIVPENIV